MRGEVWWVNFEQSIGSEIQKIRPAVIVSNNISNAHIDRFQVVPLTSNIDRIFPGEALISVLDKKGKAITNQLTTVSKERLIKKYTDIHSVDMLAIEQALRTQLGLS